MTDKISTAETPPFLPEPTAELNNLLATEDVKKKFGSAEEIKSEATRLKKLVGEKPTKSRLNQIAKG